MTQEGRRGSALEMSAALRHMSSRALRLQQARAGPPEILPIIPVSCPAVFVMEMSKRSGG